MHIRKASLEPLVFEGMTIFDYTSSPDFSSSFAIIEVPPGVSHAKAWSKRSDKYYYIAQGEIELQLEDRRLDLCQGDLCVIKQGKRLSYQNKGQVTAILVCVHTPDFQIDQEVYGDDTESS